MATVKFEHETKDTNGNEKKAQLSCNKYLSVHLRHRVCQLFQLIDHQMREFLLNQNLQLKNFVEHIFKVSIQITVKLSLKFRKSIDRGYFSTIKFDIHVLNVYVIPIKCDCISLC